MSELGSQPTDPEPPACEIRGLQWKHVDWDNARIQIRRSKTPAGWREPSLNDACARALKELNSRAKVVGFDDFHDGRHTALTRLAEKGQPDWVIQAQMGHVSPAMMRTYSHIRRKALDEAAAALEPSFKLKFPRHRRGLKATLHADKTKKPTSHERCDRLMSQFTSQWDDLKKEIREKSKGFGSSGWTRTSNPPVNSAIQVVGHGVLRARSSDENLLIRGVRQRIVQRLFSPP